MSRSSGRRGLCGRITGAAVASALAISLAGPPAWGHSFPPLHTAVLQVERCEVALLVGYTALTTGSYGSIGQLYDRVELSAKVPPFIDAGGGSLALTIGDLVATFKRGQTIATEVAVNAQIDVKVTTGADGKPRLDVGAPTTYVDVLDENVEGANTLSNAQFEAITSFALARVVAVGSGAVGAIPLPAFGGIAMHDVGIAEQAGYLVVDGNLQ